jgi:hypothetical protein
MKNTIETLIAQNQALNNELTEAIDARFLLLMEDLLQNGANPNWIPIQIKNINEIRFRNQSVVRAEQQAAAEL